MKKIKIILGLIIAFILCFANFSYAEESIDEEIEEKLIQDTVVELKYQYNAETNTVLATMVSNRELQDTKKSWKLSEDKKQYTFEFTTNCSYGTTVIDIYGNVIPVQINVTEIDDSPAQVEMLYEYKEETNTVIATMVSNRELQDTKKSWKLSEDKKQYAFEFTTNCSYGTTVIDIFGNVIPVQIEVTHIDDTPAQVDIYYEYIENTNTVKATIISNKELQDTKRAWKLSEDKKQYTFEFTTNCSYGTTVIDIFGNVIPVQIEVTHIDDNQTKVEMEYKYNEENNTVIATMISNRQLQDTKKTWKLSEDKKQYTFEFTTNCSYGTTVIDIYGNIIFVEINVTQIDEKVPEITVDYKYNDDDTVTVYLISNEPLGNTKPKWTLSSDKLVYTAKFYTDQDYSTAVQDVYGNSTNVNINFKMRKFTYNQEDKSTITVRYLYKARKEVVVDIISSVKMVDTKPTWTLSEDGYKYTKVFYNDHTYVTPIQDINGVTKDVKIMVNISQNILKGIDVSKHNGKIDWEKVRNAGIDFAIIRVGYGQDKVEQDDPMFAYNISECERLGIPYGVYIYSYALNVENALSEADHVLRLIKGHNPEFGIWYDVEDADGYKANNGMPSNEMFVEMTVAFCEKIKANGYGNVGIYASLYWLDNQLNSPKLDKYDKWVAHWADECGYTKDYVMWQYTDAGTIDGIPGRFDMNLYYKSK